MGIQLWVLILDHHSLFGFQVGLLGMARTLQQDLDRIAAQADTTTASGLHYVLTGQFNYWFSLSSCIAMEARLSPVLIDNSN